MNLKKYILAAIAACVVMAGDAQNLSKEIVVEKDYKPVEQKATRLNDVPELSKIPTINKSITFSEWNVPLNAGNAIPVLLPYGYKTEHKFSDKRGYAQFGMGMFMNMTGSAGYRILDSEKTKLNVWLQHTSQWGGNFKIVDFPDFKQKFTDEIAGVDFSHSFGNKVFSSNAYYHFARLNYIHTADLTRDLGTLFNNINEFNIAFNFANKPELETVNYNIGLKYNHFANDFPGKYSFANLIKENHYNLAGVVSMPSGEDSRVGLGITGDYLYYAQGATEIHKNKGKIKLAPYYSKSGDKFSFKLGLNVDLSFSDGTIVRFSPDVKADYKLSNGFSVYANATGGKKLNTLSEYYTINRFISPLEPIGSSYTPVDANLGLKFGPFSGFEAKVYGGYGVTNLAQMPIGEDLITNLVPTDKYKNTFFGEEMLKTTLRGINLHGFYVGLDASYSYQKIATLSVSGKYSKQDSKTGYAFGIDRPEYIIGANLEVNPIAKLKLNVGYELRGNRAIWEPTFINDMNVGYNKSDLSNVNNLNLGAYYQVHDMVGVFVQFNNILNQEWEIIPGYNSQKFSVMGGFSLQF